MRVRISLFWQAVLVVVLFAASLVVLLSSALGVVRLPAREQEARRQLTEASRRIAEEAAPLLEQLPKPGHELPTHLHYKLTTIAYNTLEDLEGVEGGFFLAGKWDTFIDHVFPTKMDLPPEPPPAPKKKKDRDPFRSPLSPDPPPNEKGPIHDQCVNSLNLAGPSLQILDIGPSRVMIVTEPIGRQRPAHMVTWVMTRLTSPEQIADKLIRFQTATGLALTGLVVALILMANLGFNLRGERRQRDLLREELRRAEYLAALGKLLAGVAHEVRNPLAAIRSTAQIYQRLTPTSRDPSMLDPILQSVDRLNALVNRLLFFARSGHEEPRPVDLNAIVQETLTLLRAQADSQRVVLRTELSSELAPLFGSSQALHQLVLNLTTNALQAMPNGGTLLCRTFRLERPPCVELTIADTGPGIAAEELPHLFEPFHTTRSEGTGLGLALCREIVQQHGGRIKLDRLVGWGAVFQVTLPLETASQIRDHPR